MCEVCNQKKSPLNSNTAPLGHISVSQPFIFWAMDYMGPLPGTSRRNKHIVVVVDHFTKWCKTFATPDQKARTVTPLLVSRIFSRFGLPVVVHSDQGWNFENITGIYGHYENAHYKLPSLVWRTDRAANRTIQAMLSAFASKRRDDFDVWLESVRFDYNASKHYAFHHMR